jgi:hypothetical protein
MGIQSGRFSPAFPDSGAMACNRLHAQDEENVVLRRPDGEFFLSADEWSASLCLVALFAFHLLRGRAWPLSKGDENRVSDKDAFDFAEILEIALSKLPETNVAPSLMWAEFRGGGKELLRELIDFCREGGFTVGVWAA